MSSSMTLPVDPAPSAKLSACLWCCVLVRTSSFSFTTSSTYFGLAGYILRGLSLLAGMPSLHVGATAGSENADEMPSVGYTGFVKVQQCTLAYRQKEAKSPHIFFMRSVYQPHRNRCYFVYLSLLLQVTPIATLLCLPDLPIWGKVSCTLVPYLPPRPDAGHEGQSAMWLGHAFLSRRGLARSNSQQDYGLQSKACNGLLSTELPESSAQDRRYREK